MLSQPLNGVVAGVKQFGVHPSQSGGDMDTSELERALAALPQLLICTSTNATLQESLDGVLADRGPSLTPQQLQQAAMSDVGAKSGPAYHRVALPSFDTSLIHHGSERNTPESAINKVGLI